MRLALGDHFKQFIARERRFGLFFVPHIRALEQRYNEPLREKENLLWG